MIDVPSTRPKLELSWSEIKFLRHLKITKGPQRLLNLGAWSGCTVDGSVLYVPYASYVSWPDSGDDIPYSFYKD